MCGGSFFIIRMGHINYANIKTSAIVHYFKEFVKKKKKKKILFFNSKDFDISKNFP